MKRDWTEIVRDKMSESEIAPPNDLWRSISSDLDVEFSNPTSRRIIVPWRWIGAAACLAALVLCGIFVFEWVRPTDLTDAMLADTEVKVPIGTTIEPSTAVEGIPSEKKGAKTSTVDISAVAAKAEENVQEITEIMPEDIITVEEIRTSTECQDTSLVETIDYEESLIAQAVEVNDVEVVKLWPNHSSFSFYASNTNMPNLSNGSNINTNTGDYFCEMAEYRGNNSNYQSFHSAVSMGNILKEVHHRQPLRFGLSARLPLSEIFSISTGVTYSLLSSSLIWDNEVGVPYEVNQMLHYIGIPLAVDYNVPAYRMVSFYVTAGAMVEKCMYGQTKVEHSPDTERVSEHGLQMSLFTGIGMQLNLSARIGLFAEPLATYYLDNHSDVINIYKDRPLNFDLRIGLRYTLK